MRGSNPQCTGRQIESLMGLPVPPTQHERHVRVTIPPRYLDRVPCSPLTTTRRVPRLSYLAPTGTTDRGRSIPHQFYGCYLDFTAVGEGLAGIEPALLRLQRSGFAISPQTHGANGGNRTPDAHCFKVALFHLSYVSNALACLHHTPPAKDGCWVSNPTF